MILTLIVLLLMLFGIMGFSWGALAFFFIVDVLLLQVAISE